MLVWDVWCLCGGVCGVSMGWGVVCVVGCVMLVWDGGCLVRCVMLVWDGGCLHDGVCDVSMGWGVFVWWGV